MKKAKNVHNLDSLEREIYRLRLEAKKSEAQMSDNFDYLQDNFGTLLMNSFSCKKRNNAGQKSNFFDSAMKDEALRFALNRVTDHIAGRTIDGIDSLITRIFRKKNKA